MDEAQVATHKRCPRCAETKPRTDFYKDRGKKSGLMSHCKRCIRRRASTEGRRYRLKRLYGLTVEQHDAMLTEQGGTCAICRQPETRNGGTLSVDHRHCDDLVRGLLCDDCNTSIGKMGESPARLRAAADYIERSST